MTAHILNRPDGPALREYVLGELRCAGMRARLAAIDIDTIGLALKSHMIGPHEAIEWLADAGALDYVDPTPPEVSS